MKHVIDARVALEVQRLPAHGTCPGNRHIHQGQYRFRPGGGRGRCNSKRFDSEHFDSDVRR
ncbi:hypothetical protein GCM10022403_046310 [Streptomyces coacervatus]|uniref:Uncharacterized protein n=1 Tax=Streptomyces coacervatus TaxID=647381 RepID=A0ABP7HZK4_9ACTN